MSKSSPKKSAKVSANTSTSPKATADELERVIAHLDTAYEQGNECLHPTTKILVTDGEYDALRRKLAELRPKSKLFATATASELASTAAKVVHDPPMTSIEKASHEDLDKQQQQLFQVALQSNLSCQRKSFVGAPVKS